ncbi:hypothetical protein [Yoonia sp. SS1-5]|uniref:Oligosaccharide repeat unit polymerase n=1 Tax=Yoonia rhodophyticola TaxID=3137370 RepID=A0AAN0NJN3_9RHOB
MIRLFLVIAALRTFYDLVFVFYIVPIWGYLGYSFEFNALGGILALLQLLVLTALTPVRVEKPSDLALTLLSAFLVLPFQTLVVFGGGSLLQLASPFLSLVIIKLLTSGPAYRMRPVKQGYSVYVAFSICAIFGYLAFAVASGGLSNFNIDITRVYDFREIQKAEIQSGVFAYMGNWVYKIIIPMAAVLLYAQKRYVALCGLLVLVLAFFGMSNHKTTLVLPFVGIGVYHVMRRRPTSHKIILGFIALLVVSMAVALLTDNHLLASFLVRRAIFASGANFMNYEIFFGEFGHLYWSNSVLSAFLDYQYEISPSLIIGEYVGSGANANSGYIASGYMHAGIFGIVIYSVILAAYLKFLDSFAGTQNGTIVTAVVAGPLLHLYQNVDLVIAFNTHGLALLAILVYLAASVEQRGSNTASGARPRPLGQGLTPYRKV